MRSEASRVIKYILTGIGGALIVCFIALTNELGRYCEELNPYNNNHDIGEDFE